MWPTLEMFGWVLPSWHVMYVVAAIVAWFAMQYWIREEGEDLQRELWPLYCLCYVAGYFGARLFSIIVESEHRHWHDLLEAGAMTMYGGFLGALCVGTLWLRWRKVARRDILFEVSVAGGLLAIAIGRIGCFMNGDDYGIVSDVWFAVSFPSHGQMQPRLPVQLFESFAVMLCVVSVMCYRVQLRRVFRKGGTGWLLIVVYAVQRFVNEFYRDDPRGTFLYGFSPAQCLSIVCAVFAVWQLFKVKTHRKAKSQFL